MESEERLKPGDILRDRYRVVRLLGRGGMGEVYEVGDTQSGNTLALKTIRHERLTDLRARQRFSREARVVASLDHPNIFRLHDIEMMAVPPFFTMELLRGDTLAVMLEREGTLAPKQLEPLVQQLCAALEYAHGLGVIHRDIKPSNVFVDQGRVVLTDFGLASDFTSVSESLTHSGEVLGTPRYVAPEQLLEGIATARTDIYCVGLILFEMLTGRLPFQGEGVLGHAVARLTQSPARLRDFKPSLSRQLEELILKCLARDPEQRPRSALEVSSAFSQALEERSNLRWLAGLGGAVVVAITMIGLLGIYVGRPARLFEGLGTTRRPESAPTEKRLMSSTSPAFLDQSCSSHALGPGGAVTFRVRALNRDGSAISPMKVHLLDREGRETAIIMSYTRGPTTSGAEFQHTVTLNSAGALRYFFSAATEGGALTKYPSFGSFRGPIVRESSNEPGLLIRAAVRPIPGERPIRSFVFELAFSSEGTLPDAITLYLLDPQTRHLSSREAQVSGEVRAGEGKLFEVKTDLLSVGQWTYYAVAITADGEAIRLPASGTYEGPRVGN